MHRHRFLQIPQIRTFRRCRFCWFEYYHSLARRYYVSCPFKGSRNLRPQASGLRHGMACSSIRSLQYPCGFVHHSCLSVRQLGTSHPGMHTHSQYRPVELLAFCIHRCCMLFHDRQHSMGILRCHNLLHHNPCAGRPHSKEIPEVLSWSGWHLYPAAFLSGFHAICCMYK